MNYQVESTEPLSEKPKEVKEDKGLLANAQSEVDATKVEADGQLEPMPHKAEDVEEKIPERPDYVPEKLWDDKEGKLRDEDVFKSLSELEKKFSQGKHKSPENYDDKVLVDAGYEKDDPLVSKYTEWAKSNNISQGAFEDLATSIIEMAGENVKQEELNSQREMERLGPNAKEIVEQNIEWKESLERKGIFSKENAELMTEWGATANGNLLLQKIRGLIHGRETLPSTVNTDLPESDLEFEARMSEMRNDPRYETDSAFNRKIEQEYERRYPVP